MNDAGAMPHSVQCLLERLSARTARDRVFQLDPQRWLELVGINGASAPRRYSLILGQVPFTGSVARSASVDLRTGRAELLVIAGVLQALEVGGRALLLVPESVLGERTRAHQTLRARLLNDGRLQAVIRLPAGWVKPRTSAALLVFEKGGATDRVWFCEARALASARRGPSATRTLSSGDALSTAVPAEVLDILARWESRSDAEDAKARGSASFNVSRAEIEPPECSLVFARYRSHATASDPHTPPPHEILAEIAGLEAEIFQSLRELVGKLKP